jgi:DNA invertase Pin-like site-specific DNA recombinase
LVTVLAAIAEFERELIRERTGAGRARAMVEGIKFGRKRKLSDYRAPKRSSDVRPARRWPPSPRATASIYR